jgi:hypothetical protein
MIKVPRPFRWLPYVPGVVTCVPLDGEDTLTLTGQMSGCWLTIFVLNADGRKYIGHIGTAAGQSGLTQQAKTAWCNAVSSGQITPKQAYNPYDKSLFGICKPGEVPEFYGAIDPSGKCQTVVLAKPSNASGDPWVRRVAKRVDQQTQENVPNDFCPGTLQSAVQSFLGMQIRL